MAHCFCQMRANLEQICGFRKGPGSRMQAMRTESVLEKNEKGLLCFFLKNMQMFTAIFPLNIVFDLALHLFLYFFILDMV